METEKVFCPECGHEFVQGESNYNYNTGLLDYECPECGWSGTELETEYCEPLLEDFLITKKG